MLGKTEGPRSGRPAREGRLTPVDVAELRESGRLICLPPGSPELDAEPGPPGISLPFPPNKPKGKPNTDPSLGVEGMEYIIDVSCGAEGLTQRVLSLQAPLSCSGVSPGGVGKMEAHSLAQGSGA